MLCATQADEMPRAAVPAVAPVPLISGDVQFRSNFVARGISQSQGQPSLQAEIDINSDDGVYGGFDGDSINWIDQLYPGDSVDMEVDGWLGYRKHFGPDWTAKAGFVRIQFPGHYVQQTPPADQPNSVEAFGYLAWRSLSVQLNYAVADYVNTPDSKGTLYLSASVSQPIGASWTLEADIGHVRHAGHDPTTGQPNSRLDNTDYELSIAYGFGSGVNLTLAHSWTTADPSIYTLDGYALAGHHTWLSLEKDF
ncbi:MAG TPA: TorF family putative porin [Gammaproteobacteria bacterium]